MSEMPFKAEITEKKSDGESRAAPLRALIAAKHIGFAAIKSLIFMIILADAILGMATIIYGIDNDRSIAFLFWIGLAFLSYQFIGLIESHRIEKGLKASDGWSIAKMTAAAAMGAIMGAMIWPAFDNTLAVVVGFAFGSLLGLFIELTMDLIGLSLQRA